MSNVVSWNLTILSGQTDSNAVDLSEAGANKAYTVNIIAPATLTGTVKPYVADYVAGLFVVQQSGGSDITIPAAKATTLSPLVAGAIRLTSSAPEGADRVFRVKAMET